jgi:ABC-type uncharacterized transport system permease subunit
MNVDLDLWFLGGASLLGLNSLVYMFNTWRGDGKTLTWAHRLFNISLGFWALLLVCWLIHTGGSGASRLWFGLSALAIGLSYQVLSRKVMIDTLGGGLSALCALLGVFSYQLGPKVDFLTHEVSSKELPISLVIHIAFALAGLTAFAVSAAMSGLYVMVSRRLKSKNFLMGSKKLPSLSTLDAFNLKGLLIGFPLYTVALLIGSAHAFQGTGELSISYLVALGSWLTYGGVLQARLTAGWRGRKAAWLTLIAFAGLLLVAGSYSFRS